MDLNKKITDLWSGLRWMRRLAIQNLNNRVRGLDIEEAEVKEIYFYPNMNDPFLPEGYLYESMEDGDIIMGMKIKVLINNLESSGESMNELMRRGEVTLLDRNGSSSNIATYYRAYYTMEFTFNADEIRNLDPENGPIDIKFEVPEGIE